jgi:hypothetical protein
MPPVFGSTISTIMYHFGLVDIPSEEGGLYDGLICTKDQARYIQKLAWLSIISSVVAAYRGHYDLCVAVSGVGATSLLYWSKPTYGLRRTIDISYVAASLLFHMWKATTATNKIPYFGIKIMAMLCYPIGCYYQKHNLSWAACFWHGGIHILGNIANIILYCGDIT